MTSALRKTCALLHPDAHLVPIHSPSAVAAERGGVVGGKALPNSIKASDRQFSVKTRPRTHADERLASQKKKQRSVRHRLMRNNIILQESGNICTGSPPIAPFCLGREICRQIIRGLHRPPLLHHCQPATHSYVARQPALLGLHMPNGGASPAAPHRAHMHRVQLALYVTSMRGTTPVHQQNAGALPGGRRPPPILTSTLPQILLNSIFPDKKTCSTSDLNTG